jgi:MFS transporter, ceroid-lipofuscinosis neuronal protein 7
VSVFSIGRLVISAPIGWFCDKYRHRWALIVSGILMLFGAILWSSVLAANQIAVLFLAQLFLGLGTGSLGVTRAYVAEQTRAEQRTNALSLVTAVQYAGFAATPILGSLLYSLGRLAFSSEALVTPAFAICIMAVICLGLLIYPFKDLEYFQTSLTSTLITTDEENKKTISEQSAENNNNNNNNNENKPEETYNALVIHVVTQENSNQGSSEIDSDQNIIVEQTTVLNDKKEQEEYQKLQRFYTFYFMIFLNFTTRGIVAIYETQISALLLDSYHLTEVQLGAIVSISGIVGTLQLIFFKQIWTKYFSDFSLMLIGLMIIIFAQILIVVWGPDRLKPIWTVLLAIFFIYAIGYPVANTAVLGCFSKLQKQGKQGFIQSIFALMGSFARVIFPIISGYFESDIETTSSFGLGGMLACLSIMGIIWFQYGIMDAHTNIEQTQWDQHFLQYFQSKTWKERQQLHSFQIIVIFTSFLFGMAFVGAMVDWGIPGW